MAEKSSSLISKILIGIIIILVVSFGAYYFMNRSSSSSGSSSSLNIESSSIDYPAKMYQLRDGSYLRLGFAVVVSEDQESEAKDIIDKNSSTIADGINMILGEKSQEDLIAGTHKRNQFAHDIMEMLEHDVFRNYNARQTNASERIVVKDVLIHEFVTQQS